jgi:hypothetical protein
MTSNDRHPGLTRQAKNQPSPTLNRDSSAKRQPSDMTRAVSANQPCRLSHTAASSRRTTPELY